MTSQRTNNHTMSNAPINPEENAAEWLSTNWPNMKKMDMSWTAEKYDYPQYVRDYIEQNWIKESDDNGGTYVKPPLKKMDNSKADKLEQEKSFGRDVQKSGWYQAMEQHNKEATDVMAKEGMDAAVKYMFTDRKTGRQLSYGEMRMLYG